MILWTSLADLIDTGSAERDCSVVWALKDELILYLVGRGVSDLGATEHNNELVLLSSQEVLDEDAVTVLGGSCVDWEMRISKSHLVSEALCIV